MERSIAGQSRVYRRARRLRRSDGESVGAGLRGVRVRPALPAALHLPQEEHPEEEDHVGCGAER